MALHCCAGEAEVAEVASVGGMMVVVQVHVQVQVQH